MNFFNSEQDRLDWLKGLEFDLSSRNWGGKGWRKNPDGKGGEIKEKTRTIRIHKSKPVKTIADIKPAIGVLTNHNDSGGRTLAEHRARVDAMAALYDNRLDMLTGEPITDESEFRGCDKERDNEPWRDSRHAAHTDAEGLALLSQVFKAQHDASFNED